MSQRLQVRLLSIFVLFIAWEYFGRRANPILFTYPTAIIRAFIGLVTSGELQSYMKRAFWFCSTPRSLPWSWAFSLVWSWGASLSWIGPRIFTSARSTPCRWLRWSL